MGLSSSKRKDKTYLVFDIRDAALSMAVVKFNVDTGAEIIICKNYSITKEYVTDHLKYFASVSEIIDTGIHEITKDYMAMGNSERVNRYAFFFGSPWSLSQMKLIKVIKERAFEINDQFLETIITTQEKPRYEAGTISDPKNWSILEEQIIQSRLNGYKVRNIFGKKAKHVDIELFVSFIPTEIKEKVFSLSGNKSFNAISVEAHSSTLSSYLFLRDLFLNWNDFLYIDIGYFITDIYVVRDGMISATASFPYGEKDFITAAVKMGKLPATLIASSLAIVHDEKHEIEYQKQIETMFQSAIDPWYKRFEEIMTRICDEGNVPTTIFSAYHSGPQNLLIQEILRRNKKTPLQVFGKNVQFEMIHEDALNKLIINGKSFTNQPHLKMDIVFLDRTA